MTSNHERDMLSFLARTAKRGISFGNMMDDELGKAEPAEVLATLRSLEKKGYIKLSGPRTLNDLAKLIEEKSNELVTMEQQKKAKRAGELNHCILFSDNLEYFDTMIRPTMKGLFANYSRRGKLHAANAAAAPGPKPPTAASPESGARSIAKDQCGRGK